MLTPTSDPEPRLLATAVGDVAVAEEGPAGAPAVLCVHGLPGTSRDFRYLGPPLAQRFRVLRVEMPGFGRSPTSDVRSVAGWARTLAAVREAAALDRPLLLGHSFGGGACLLAAATEPDGWRGLALLASLGLEVHRAMRWSPRTYGLYAAGLRRPLARPLLALTARRGYRRAGLAPPSSWRELLLHVELLASVDFAALAVAARAANLPALVAWCRDDRVSQPSVQRELQAALPRSTPLELETGGHHLHKHRAREVAAAVVERFGA